MTDTTPADTPGVECVTARRAATGKKSVSMGASAARMRRARRSSVAVEGAEGAESERGGRLRAILLWHGLLGAP